MNTQEWILACAIVTWSLWMYLDIRNKVKRSRAALYESHVNGIFEVCEIDAEHLPEFFFEDIHEHNVEMDNYTNLFPIVDLISLAPERSSQVVKDIATANPSATHFTIINLA